VVWIIPFLADHLLMFDRHLSSENVIVPTYDQFKRIEGSKFAHTVLVEGGIVACGGIVQYWSGRGEAWAVINKLAKRHFLTLHYVVKNYLESVSLHRVEATVAKDFNNGHRWAKLLGFELEAETLKAYSANKLDYSLYARVK